jgi:hypothetical protein
MPKLLPITDIELPNGDWAMQNFKENRAFSEETTCFTATLVHLPSKYKMHVRNDGRGGADFIDGDYQHPKHREIQEVWKQFVLDATPALQASVADGPDWSRDLYKEPSFSNEESVIGLFVGEMQNQQSLSRKRGVIVRTPDSREAFSHYSKATPEMLMGKVVGEFWDKKTKNWVSL